MADLATMLVSFKADMTSLDEGISKAKEGLGSVGEKAGEAGRHADEAGGHFKEFFAGIRDMAMEYAVEGFDFLKERITDVIAVTQQHNQIMAQTVAGLKSTGDASGETAQSISALADSLSQVTPYSQDTIQSAENMELTFTNIGKNVFPQATQAILDLSTKMGGDLQGATIQVGKALGAPLTGLTALTRVGVVFNDTQKNLIKTYMAHGQVAQAQGVILQELSKEFGGSADAAGKADGGIAILKNRLEDLEIKIGTAVTPVISKLVAQVGPLITSFADWIDKSGVLTDITSQLSTQLQNAGNFIHDDLLPPLEELYNAAKPIITDFIDWNDKTRFLQNTLSDVGQLLVKTADDIATNLLPPIRSLLSNLEDWTTKSNIVHDALSGLGDAIGITSQVLGTLIGWISDLVGWFDQSTPRADALKDVLFGIAGIIATMKVIDFGKNVFQMGMQAKDAATHFLDLAGTIKNKLGDAFDWLSGRAKSAEKDVASASEGMGKELGGVATAEKTVGENAATAAPEVSGLATAEGELATETKPVGGELEAAAVGETAAGTEAATAAPEIGLFSGALGGLAAIATSSGIAAIIGLEGYLTKDAIAALISNYTGGSQNPTGNPDIQQRLNRQQGQVIGRATGGLDLPAGVPYVAGERGPELIYPQGSTNVYTAPQTAAMLASGAGVGDIHVHATIPVYLDGQQLAGPMGQHLVNEIRILTGSRQ